MIEIGKELRIMQEESFDDIAIDKRLNLIVDKRRVNDIEFGGNDYSYIDVIPEKSSVRSAIGSLLSVDAKNKTMYSKRKALSDRVNDAYTKIDTLLRNNIKSRKIHAGDILEGSYKFLYIYNPKKKELYKFTYAKAFINMEGIGSDIKKEMASIASNAKPDYRSLEAYKESLIKALHNNFWFVLETELLVKSSENIKGRLDDHVRTTKNNADNAYAHLINITNINSLENKYALLFKKQYDELEYAYSKDKTAMKLIDDIFNECIKYTEASMKFNYDASVILTEFMEHYVQQMERFYSSLQ